MSASTTQLDALLQRATLALNAGAYRELQQLCRQILAIDKDQADAWFFMSIVAEAGGQPGHALQFVDRALLLVPAHPEYLSQKARLHSLLNQFPQARDAAERAIGTQPEQAIVLDTLGVVFTRLGYHDKAAGLLRQAVQKQPDNPQFQFNLGSALQFLGQDQQAREAYAAAIANRPDFSRAYWALSELDKNRADPGRLEALQALHERNTNSTDDQLYLAHALSREYEKRQDYDQAFSCLAAAKQRRRSGINYAVDDDLALFKTVRELFTDSPPVKASSTPLASRPLFIVGMPRTGTTLVERILGSHSGVLSLGELQDFPRALKKLAGTRTNRVLDRETVATAGQKSMAQLGRSYAAMLADRVPQQGWFIDKLPLNFLCAGFIRAAMPDARIVCLRRNPLDTCLSNYRQLFALNYPYYNYSYDLADTARYYVGFHGLIELWQELLGDGFYQLRYEQLIEEPEPTVRELLDFVGLDWEAGCLDFHRNTSAVATASAAQVRQPLYSSAVARWRKYEKHLTPAMEVLDAAGVSYL